MKLLPVRARPASATMPSGVRMLRSSAAASSHTWRGGGGRGGGGGPGGQEGGGRGVAGQSACAPSRPAPARQAVDAGTCRGWGWGAAAGASAAPADAAALAVLVRISGSCGEVRLHCALLPRSWCAPAAGSQRPLRTRTRARWAERRRAGVRSRCAGC